MRIPFAFLLAFPLILAAGESSAAEPKKAQTTVVDLHNQAGHDAVLRRGDGWVTVGMVEEELPVTVDLKNGFLEWSDEGTGGGTRKVQSALFRTADRLSLLVSFSALFDGVGVGGTLTVHEQREGKMVPADERLPRPAPAAFLTDAGAPLAQQHPDWLEHLGVLYTLPRVGTTIVATLDQTFAHLKLRELPEAERAAREAFLDEAFHASIELTFDKKAGKFSLGRKGAAAKRPGK